jgi:hypothetical protein
LACQDQFLANNPLDVKEGDEHALDFALRLSHFFREVQKFDVVPLLDPLRNLISPDTQLQIKERQMSAIPLSCVKFCTLDPKTCK